MLSSFSSYGMRLNANQIFNFTELTSIIVTLSKEIQKQSIESSKIVQNDNIDYSKFIQNYLMNDPNPSLSEEQCDELLRRLNLLHDLFINQYIHHPTLTFGWRSVVVLMSFCLSDTFEKSTIIEENTSLMEEVCNTKDPFFERLCKQFGITKGNFYQEP